MNRKHHEKSFSIHFCVQTYDSAKSVLLMNITKEGETMTYLIRLSHLYSIVFNILESNDNNLDNLYHFTLNFKTINGDNLN